VASGEGGTEEVTELAIADELKPGGDEPVVAPAAVPPPAVRPLAELLVPMDRAALDLLTDAERTARRWAMYEMYKAKRDGKKWVISQ
jgi:hypothetical protein